MRAELFSKFVVSVGLIAITWTVFGQTVHFDFVNYDDNKYVYASNEISRGVSPAGIKWAFKHFDKDNWHPLTSISHMVDCQLFGLEAGWHHLTNVLLHTIAVVGLFLVLNSMTGSLWSSAFVAAVFAVHPLHVESVAWIAERKDVLSALFFVLTLAAYVHYARRPTVARYVVTSIAFAAGLMSKAMLVTLPVVLLLLDYWPLQRLEKSRAGRLVLEKAPLFFLSVLSSIATLLAQKAWLIPVEELPVRWRLANAEWSCLVYIWQMIWPVNLTVIYPHRTTFSPLQMVGAGAFLAAISVGVFLCRRRSPYLVTGWYWYLIMLVPVLGLIKAGGLAHADRYTHLPEIGLYIAVTWGIVDLTKSWRQRRAFVALGAATVIVLLTCNAWSQTKIWRDGETLWRHTIAVTANNDLAHFILADFLAEHGRIDESIAEYESGLSIDPSNGDAETNLANLLLAAGRTSEAIVHYDNIVVRDPGSPFAHFNLGVGLERARRLSEAIDEYNATLRIQPDYPDAASYLDQALLKSRELNESSPEQH